MARIAVARQEGFVPAISTVTLAEVLRTGQVGRRPAWQRPRLTVIPAAETVADLAALLLEDTGLDGHECVVDALVVATAATGSGPAKVTSGDASHVPELIEAAKLRRASPLGWVPLRPSVSTRSPGQGRWWGRGPEGDGKTPGTHTRPPAGQSTVLSAEGC
ncbi:hypothetical protein [Streptosporangium vulgare]|uniref:PIN domain-containing protein n=1 Tax=Streptosporangium vulgare TaxID=46190 RepID=A0ABV5T9C2_9ACTN